VPSVLEFVMSNLLIHTGQTPEAHELCLLVCFFVCFRSSLFLFTFVFCFSNKEVFKNQKFILSGLLAMLVQRGFIPHLRNTDKDLLILFHSTSTQRQLKTR
jgi:hypothetical protein